MNQKIADLVYEYQLVSHTHPKEMDSNEAVLECISKICAEKEAEISRLRGENTGLRHDAANNEHNVALYVKNLAEQLSEAQTTIAMQTEALFQIKWHRDIGSRETKYSNEIEDMAGRAISYSAESVAAWEANNLEPLRREVAMLRKVIMDGDDEMDGRNSFRSISTEVAMKAITDTQATAEAYESKLKEKVLEEAAQMLNKVGSVHADDCAILVRRMKREICALSEQKKEGES